MPRLSLHGVRRLLASAELMQAPWRDRRAAAERWTTLPPVGGAVAGEAALAVLAEDLLTIAIASGFPDDDRQAAVFDAEAAVLLGQGGHMRESDALRDDVWAFVATVLLPEIVRWRFGSKEERYRGGVRNVFQRLWLRAMALDRGPQAGEDRWVLVRALNEDAIAAIIERPGLAGSRAVSRALGERWSQERLTAGPGGLEDRMRSVARNLLVTNQVMRLELLGSADLEAEIDRLFVSAAAAP
jgi:hypothetical protein